MLKEPTLYLYIFKPGRKASSHLTEKVLILCIAVDVGAEIWRPYIMTVKMGYRSDISPLSIHNGLQPDVMLTGVLI